MYNQKPLLGSLINWAHPLSKGLVGVWIMNEGSGNKVFDLSGKGNHGTFGAGAAAPTWVPGRTGPALDFDSVDDYIDCDNDVGLNCNSAITIAIWVKPHETYSGSHWNGIISKSAADGWDNSVYGIAAAYAVWYFHVTTNIAAKYIDISSAPDENNWTHLVGTYDGAYLRLYRNGISVATPVANTGAINTITDNLYLGYGNDVYYFNGAIDDVMIYNRALSANEIWQLYVDSYCMFAQPMEAELMYAAPPVGAIINQFQRANLGADLYDGVLIT